MGIPIPPEAKEIEFRPSCASCEVLMVEFTPQTPCASARKGPHAHYRCPKCDPPRPGACFFVTFSDLGAEGAA